MPPYVAILEDDAGRLAPMRPCLVRLLPQYEHAFFDNASEMIAWLPDHLHETVLISLDHDLPLRQVRNGQLVDAGTGRQVADYLATVPPVSPIIVHTSNEHFAPGMMWVLSDAGWYCRRIYPDAYHAWLGLAWSQEIRRMVASGDIFR